MADERGNIHHEQAEYTEMNDTTNRVPIAPGLFTWPAPEPRLIGSRCRSCGEVKFPAQGSCANCCSEEVEELLLARRGKLWSWTVQAFPPKSPPYAGPAPFEPFGVGYVELPGQVCVESRLSTADPQRLRIGMEMELAIEPMHIDANGNEVVCFCFQPVEEQQP